MSLKLAAVAGLACVALIGTGTLTGLFDGPPELASEAMAQGGLAADGAPQAQARVPGPATVAPRRDAVLTAADDAGRAAAAGAPPSEPLVTRVRARLVDDAGLALAGARLASIHADGRPRGARSSGTTDGDGRVELALADGAVRHWEEQVFPMVFAASAEGRATSFVISTPRWHGETDLGDVVLGPGGVLTGIVVDDAGRGVPGALLYAAEPLVTGDLAARRLSGLADDVVRPRADAGPDGRFRLGGVVPGAARLWVHAEGYLWTISEPVEVVAAGERDCGALVLEAVPAERSVRGLVLRPDGSPAAGAEVAYESNAIRQEGTLGADEQGRFVLVPRGNASLQLLARDPAGRFGQSALTAVQAGMEVELRLSERRTIVLSVVEPDGAPIEGASVMPFALSESPMMDGLAAFPGQDWIHTDAEGRALVPVPAETFQVSGSKRGYEGQRAGPFEPASAPAELELQLVPEPRIEGRVLAYGEPVAGMRITIGERIPGFVPREAGFPIRFFGNSKGDVESGPDGRFSCPVDGEWTEIAVVAVGDAYATGETQLTIQAGQGASGVVVEVTAGGVVTGTLLPPAGRSAGGQVVAASRGDGFPVWTRTDADGRYRLERLTPGPWRVEGRDREPAREVLSVANRPEDQEFGWNVEVVDGREVTFDVDMRGLGDVELSGRFRVDGRPAAGWTAELVPPREALTREPLPAAALDADGHFSLTARAGRYDLRLVGTLEGGVRVELLRELRLEGQRRDWDGELTTGPLAESVGGEHEELRLVRGPYYEGDREITHVPLVDGRCEARVPVGRASLQVQVATTEWGPAWETLRTVEVR